MNRNGRIIPENHSPGILMHGALESMIKRREEIQTLERFRLEIVYEVFIGRFVNIDYHLSVTRIA
jgi:hypothetical protein